MERVLKTAGRILDAVVRLAFGLVCVVMAAGAVVYALLMVENLFVPAPFCEIVLGATLVIGTTGFVVYLSVMGAAEMFFGLKPEEG